MSETRASSRLLALPPEIRNLIYSFAIVNDYTVHLPKWHRSGQSLQEPGLLTVNRQIRSEAMPLFYGESTFHLTDSYDTERFVRTITKSKSALIRSIKAFSETNALTSVTSYWHSLVTMRCRTFAREGLVRLDAVLVPLPIGEDRVIAWIRADRLDDFVPAAVKDAQHFVRKDSAV